MGRSYNIFVATGLGKAVGNLFVANLQKIIDQQFPTVRIYSRFVDLCSILPVLRESRKVAEVLLHVLVSPQGPVHDLVLIPCNSVHIGSPYLKQILGDCFVPIDEAVISLIGREGIKARFLILGTSNTVESGMYQEGLRLLGCESVVLPLDAQEELDDFIFNDLVGGEMEPSHLCFLRKFECHYMEQMGADYVILACTELCYLVQVFSNLLVCEVDSLQALHDAAMERLKYCLNKELGLAH